IRLQNPAVVLVRDKDGQVPFLDRLLNLPFLKRQDQQFNLDLRSIRVQNGVIDFSDQWTEGAIGAWRLSNASITLERVRGQRLREFMKELFNKPQTASSGSALRFIMNGELIQGGAKVALKGAGRLAFPDEMEFRTARWNADFELVNFPAFLIKE